MACAGCLRIRAALKNGIRVVAKPIIVRSAPKPLEPRPKPPEKK